MTQEEIKQTYGLNCNRCGDVFKSSVAFPEPHICPKCSKREEIREGIAQYIKTYYGEFPIEHLAGLILDYLHSQGVVIKVDRELPPIYQNPDKYHDGEVESAIGTQELMLKAGYVATEPLIE